MLLVWIVYLAALSVSGIFVILYKDLLALLLFCTVAAVPLILLVCLCLARALTKISVSADKSLLTQGGAAVIRVSVRNRSPFPLTCITLRLLCQNQTLGTEYNCEFTLSCGAFKTQLYELELHSQNVGNIHLLLRRAKLYDMFRLFWFPYRISYEKTVPVIPPIAQISTALRPNNLSVGESNVFSKIKPGDDPSEVFGIRDYAGGDKLNRIHWKLTVKQNKYMVKDYSLPINEAALLYLDFNCSSDERELLRFDTAVQALVSVSRNLCEHSVMHSVCWYDTADGQFYSEPIATEADIFTTLGRLYHSHIAAELPSVLDSQLFSRSYLSHLVWFTANSGSGVAELIESSGTHRFLSSVVCSSFEGEDTTAGTDRVPVIPVHYGKVDVSLTDVLL